MAEPWIRVHANLGGKPIVWRLAAALRVSENEAIGLLVRFWGAMSQLGDNGHIDRLEDRQIESWAGWRGKRGQLAAFLRAHHADDEGRVNEWDDYAGALETRREKDRERQRRLRDIRVTSRNGHTDSPRDIRASSAPTRGDEDETKTKRDETRTTTSSSARDELLSRVPHRATWEALFAGALQGLDGPMLTTEQLDRAIVDFVGNGAAHTPNVSHFRAYLRRAAKPDEPSDAPGIGPSPRRNPLGGGARNDAAIDAAVKRLEGVGNGEH